MAASLQTSLETGPEQADHRAKMGANQTNQPLRCQKHSKGRVFSQQIIRERSRSLLTCAQVFRFYFRCSACAAEMTMKTDPENADYTVEKGASRNYEPWREKDRDKAEAVAAREEEERGNAMKASHPLWLCALV